MPDLTNNDFVKAFPWVSNREGFANYCQTLNFGSDGGPKAGQYGEGWGTRPGIPWEWYPLGPQGQMDKEFQISYDNGFGLGHTGLLESGNFQFKFAPDGSLGLKLGHPHSTSDQYQPMNFGVLSGDLADPLDWAYAQYAAGVPYGYSVSSQGGTMGTTWNALNKDQATTYTIISPEFSWAPGYYGLPPEGAGLSHKMVFTINSAWYEFLGGQIFGIAGYEKYIGGYPHVNLAVHETFGIFLQRTNMNRLEFGYVCPGDLEWQTAQGIIDLGSAINHTPTNTITDQPPHAENGYYWKPWARFVGGYDTFNMKTGYVLQIGINPARTHIAVRFNGVEIHSAKLPESIITYFQNPPYDETTQTEIPLPAFCDEVPRLRSTRRKPHMGVGFAVMANLVDISGRPFGSLTQRNEFGIFGLHKASKNARNIVNASGKNPPQRMNRLDNLNSSPGWANAGKQMEPPNVSRAALWQRNNST